MKAVFIAAFLSIIAFLLVMNSDEKKAVLIMIFMLPFGGVAILVEIQIVIPVMIVIIKKTGAL